MLRRNFAKHLLWTTAGTLVLPRVFGSCKKDKPSPVNWEGKVAVIGAGAAGMYVAKLLFDRGVDYIILEAADRLGGRIRNFQNMGNTPIALGAEFIHGKKTVLYDLAEAAGFSLTNAHNLDVYDLLYLDGALQWEDDVTNDPDIQDVAGFEDELESYTGADITMLQYVDQQSGRFPQRTREILNAYTANPMGTSMDRLGMYSWAKESWRWTAGSKDYLLNSGSMLDVFINGCGVAVGNDKVKFNWQVKKIDTTGTRIAITNQQGSVENVDKVIITVPLTVLRDGDIEFVPALPAAKMTAFSRIGMDAGMKIILQFDQPFWNHKMSAVIGGSQVPEFWVPFNTSNILTGFVMGEKAEYLSTQGSNAVNIAMQELQQFFGSQMNHVQLVASFVMDWSTMPFIRGAYSYPMPGTEGQRPVLAQSVDNKIFFAGEATHTEGHAQTVHGAMETGVRAVEEFVDAVK